MSFSSPLVEALFGITKEHTAELSSLTEFMQSYAFSISEVFLSFPQPPPTSPEKGILSTLPRAFALRSHDFKFHYSIVTRRQREGKENYTR